MMEPAKPTALIADDDPLMRLLLRQTLEGAGLAVVDVEDGRALLDAFAAARPQVVLLDVLMPGMDGFETCAALRRLPGGENVPVMMLTGLDDVDSIERAYVAGATDFIAKPINWVLLGHRVRFMLRANGAFEALRESQAEIADAQRIARLGSFRWTAAGMRVDCSEETLALLGLSGQGAVADVHALHARVHAEDADFVRGSVDSALAQKAGYSIEYRLAADRGPERVIQERTEATSDADGVLTGLRGTIQDITNLRRAEERVRFLAHHDPVTQLPNRLLFHERTEQAVRRAGRDHGGLAVMVIDIDSFRLANESVGPACGDQILAAVGQRIKGVIKAGEGFGDTIAASDYELARLGGDEFGVLLSEQARPDEPARVARRLMDAFRRPFRVGEQEVFLSLSVGIATYPADGADAPELMKHAEAALFHAKHQGRNNFQFYAPAMNTRALERLTLEAQLRRALERDELVLHYQPQVDLRTGLVCGVEALVRWQHPDLGLVPPGQFIPTAEASGLILPLGDWVLRRACRDIAAWQAEGLEPPVVSVNVSAPGFQQPSFYDSVLDALIDAGIKPSQLALELTESVLMKDVESTTATLRRLAHIGVPLSVDDFGTGYSSLAYLKRFPLHAIKIDRSFVRDVALDSDDASIVIAIIQLAHGLCLTVVAEGVENEAQLAFLRGRECDIAQGYLFSRAEPFARIGEIIRAGGRLVPGRPTPGDLRLVGGEAA